MSETAFPHPRIEENADWGRREVPASRGMSLRDYFAAQALAGGMNEYFTAGDAWSDYDDFAQSCYAIADAMLKAREGK